MIFTSFTSSLSSFTGSLNSYGVLNKKHSKGNLQDILLGYGARKAPDPSPMRLKTLRHWADQWLDLKTWGGLKTNVVIYDCYKGLGLLGDCSKDGSRVRVFRAKDIVDDLVTLVHELAHAACPQASHNQKWFDTYTKAIEEITGQKADVTGAGGQNYAWLDNFAWNALSEWWRAHGYDLVYKLGEGKLHSKLNPPVALVKRSTDKPKPVRAMGMFHHFDAKVKDTYVPYYPAHSYYVQSSYNDLQSLKTTDEGVKKLLEDLIKKLKEVPLFVEPSHMKVWDV